MTSEKAFQLYFALRLHFNTPQYDVFAHGTNFRGKNEVSTRNDFKLILLIMKHVESERQLIELCVANHLYGNPDFLYDDSWAAENYRKWCKNKESLNHILQRDLSMIELQCMKNNCTFDDYMARHVISDLLSSKLEYESLILLDRGTPCIDKMAGFDSSKYKVRMHKASKFVGKGILAEQQQRQIDIFNDNVKGN